MAKFCIFFLPSSPQPFWVTPPTPLYLFCRKTKLRACQHKFREGIYNKSEVAQLRRSFLSVKICMYTQSLSCNQ